MDEPLHPRIIHKVGAVEAVADELAYAYAIYCSEDVVREIHALLLPFIGSGVVVDPFAIYFFLDLHWQIEEYF